MNRNEELEKRTRETEQIIERWLPDGTGYQKTVTDAMNYSVRVGGKRLRPLLMLETYRLFGGKGKEIEPFMAAMEMIHTFSLVHDDLPCMDNDKLRRGKPTTWVAYGYDMAVLAGDALAVYAFETAAKAFRLSGDPEAVGRAIGILAEKTGIHGMIGGQVVDVEMTGKPVPAEQLDFIYRLKTGALLEGSMLIGAVLGGADATQQKLVEKLAAAIGMAFQIRDDILDVTGSEETLGKPVFSDEKNEKTTYVTLKGLAQAKQEAERISAEAAALLQQLPGDHGFLEELILILARREK